VYSITSRRWFFPAILSAAIIIEFLGLRATWRTDLQRDSKLSELQVRSGYELLFEERPSKDAQPILTYDANGRHNHRLTLTIQSARLSEQSRALLSMLNPPKSTGVLIYAPNPSEHEPAGAPCLMTFRLEFPQQAAATARSVEIIPPTRDDVFNRSATRLVHIKSPEPLSVRVSANSDSGADGPGCRNLLSIGRWQQVIGKDLEMDFLAEPGSSIDVTLSSPSFESGKNEIESLEIERLLPQRLATHPVGMERILQSREYAGPPPLTLTDLRLGQDFFNVELTGRAAVPVAETLGWTKWPIVAAINVPLLALAVFVFRLKKTTFLSYSWADEKKVFAICERMKQAGLDVWIDRERMRGGDDWEARIRGEMLKCRRVVVFLSHAMNDGGFFLAELGLARAIANDRFQRRNFVIPVRLEEVSIPPILAKWNAIDLFEADGERKLFDVLRVDRQLKN
jgi:TIR domain-containing protein